jgi:hypothetical protein
MSRSQEIWKFLGGEKIWPEIVKLSVGRQKKAAVAYVGSDSFLRFGEGDTLVADASDESISFGRTSASVLQRAMNRGARIFSMPKLHAKVMLCGRNAVVGSANISIRSSRELIESVMITNHRKIVRELSNWIDDLAARSQEIDRGHLKRLLSLESQREPIRRSFDTLAETYLLFFKEVMSGDIEKYNRQSSTSGTGGGARDLRISPAKIFHPLLSKVISESSSRVGVTHGTVRSRVGRGKIIETDVMLWPPTQARPTEIRIARFYEVPGWALTKSRFQEAQRRNERLFYVLESDVHGTVTAKVLSDRELVASNPAVAQHLLSLKSENTDGHSIIGAVDVLNNVCAP